MHRQVLRLHVNNDSSAKSSAESTWSNDMLYGFIVVVYRVYVNTAMLITHIQ